MLSNQDISVLVVDDEALIRNTITGFLEDSGFQVTCADNGKAGLQAFHACQPDIMITDIHMPEVDGFGLIAAIHSQKPELPIIVLTGSRGEEESREKAKTLNISGFFVKPVYDLNLLEEAILAILNDFRTQINDNPILIIEDDPLMLHSIQEYLTDSNFSTLHIAHSKEEALKKVKEIHPEVVILDVMLAGKNSLELISQTDAISPKTQFIVMSGLERVEKSTEAQGLSKVQYWFSKPANLLELEMAIRKLIQKKS